MTLLVALVLSVLEPHDDACRVLRVEPPAAPVVLAEIDAHCDEVDVRWSEDATRAVVHAGRGATVQLFELDAEQRTLAELPEFPALPRVDVEVGGYDARGAVIAHAIESLPFRGPDVPMLDKEQHQLVVRGVAYEWTNSVGLPALAHAWELENGRWTLVETRATGVEACDAPGTAVLAHRISDAGAWHERHAVKDPEPGRAPGTAVIAQGRVQVVGAARNDDTPWGTQLAISAPLHLASGAPLEGLLDGEPVAIRFADDSIIVEGTKKGVHVYDAAGRVLFASPTATDARVLR